MHIYIYLWKNLTQTGNLYIYLWKNVAQTVNLYLHIIGSAPPPMVGYGQSEIMDQGWSPLSISALLDQQRGAA